jgi:hypothetical protein
MTNRFSMLVDSYRLATKRPPRRGESSSTIKSGARRNRMKAPAASALGGQRRVESSLHAPADGVPISASITECNGSVLSSGGGDGAMRVHQAITASGSAPQCTGAPSLCPTGVQQRRMRRPRSVALQDEGREPAQVGRRASGLRARCRSVPRSCRGRASLGTPRQRPLTGAILPPPPRCSETDD